MPTSSWAGWPVGLFPREGLPAAAASAAAAASVVVVVVAKVEGGQVGPVQVLTLPVEGVLEKLFHAAAAAARRIAKARAGLPAETLGAQRLFAAPLPVFRQHAVGQGSEAGRGRVVCRRRLMMIMTMMMTMMKRMRMMMMMRRRRIPALCVLGARPRRLPEVGPLWRPLRRRGVVVQLPKTFTDAVKTIRLKVYNIHLHHCISYLAGGKIFCAGIFFFQVLVETFSTFETNIGTIILV